MRYANESKFCSFDPACYVCLENAGSVKVRVKCETEEIDVPVVVTVHYRTIADTAQEYSDFLPTEGILKFEHGQKWYAYVGHSLSGPAYLSLLPPCPPPSLLHSHPLCV